ncbi:16S rRNA (guanine(966)-N(2))-methyltransferase RsmD [Cellulosilyticum sp. I15G10I2]|uniref:16S rRNA (guanine(966)-N(2))-methyltransferase RsmD n=1 Tax=Cellulosilyticum sp. I15G10I2 TaxID=1892843 RepID=UPI00085BB624|nr:16S rRNA (guanine(966)-N(2))-methyltransferase RsmD [Cellulosilyticum sp. I15G10I2]
MRVISGKCRGTRLIAPEGTLTRPTVDRIKETLFNIIAFDIPQCIFLDLFGGSGAIGIEALSRGAKQAVFVEKDKSALASIRKNLERTKLQDMAVIYESDVRAALDQLKNKSQKFDIIFLDPPYAMGDIESVLRKIAENELLYEEGYIILERSTNTLVSLPQNLVLWKEKTYKTTTLSFLRKEKDSENRNLSREF